MPKVLKQFIEMAPMLGQRDRYQVTMDLKPYDRHVEFVLDRAGIVALKNVTTRILHPITHVREDF